MKHLTKILVLLISIVIVVTFIQYIRNSEKIHNLGWDWSFNNDPILNNAAEDKIIDKLNKLNILVESSSSKDFVDLLDVMIFRKYGGDDAQVFEIRSWKQVLMGDIESSAYSYDEDPDLISIKKSNEDGLVLSEDIFQNNILSLSFRWEYFDNKRKKYENIYRNGNLVMKTQWDYYTNGNYKSITINNFLSNKTKIKSWFENGKVKSVKTFLSGLRDGKTQFQYESGQAKSTAHYVHGHIDNYSNEWFENGQQKDLKYFDNFEKVGIWKTWHQNGQIASRASYNNQTNEIEDFQEWDENGNSLTQKNNTIKTETYEYYDDCSEESECKDKEGKLKKRIVKSHTISSYDSDKDETNSTYLSWYENGNLKSKGQLINNVEVGFWSYWDDLGRILKTTELSSLGEKKEEFEYLYPDKLESNNLPEDIPNNFILTKWSDFGYKSLMKKYTNGEISKIDEWYINGHKKYEGIYVNGLKDGQWIHYRSDGSIHKNINYHNGAKEGTALTWYLNGNKEAEENYKGGLLHGNLISYRIDGSKKYEASFENGVLQGKVIWWGANDTKYIEEIYQDGVFNY